MTQNGAEKIPTDWSRYGYCPSCEQTAGAPCRDLRYPWSSHPLYRRRPHRDRMFHVEHCR